MRRTIFPNVVVITYNLILIVIMQIFMVVGYFPSWLFDNPGLVFVVWASTVVAIWSICWELQGD